MIPYLQLQSQGIAETSLGEPFIEDIVVFTHEIIFLVRVPPGAQIPSKERLECRYGGVTHFAYRKALAVHYENGRATILCGTPPKNLLWNVDFASIEVGKGDEVIRRGRLDPVYHEALAWNSTKVVYEVFSTESDVVLFAHGTNVTAGHVLGGLVADAERLKDFKCVYGGYYETAVTAAAQEVFRCPHPPADLAPFFYGKKMTLRCEGEHIWSVAFYRPTTNVTTQKLLSPPPELTIPKTSPPSSPKKHFVCACTMIYNGKEFLKEWVYYHSHLGIEKFLLYDNNSEDDLDELVDSLESFNVTRISWPWVKTQEAGFSHCALLAAPDCTWMHYIDIDEYLFPHQMLVPLTKKHVIAPPLTDVVPNRSDPGFLRSSPSVVQKLIAQAIIMPPRKRELANKSVGQIYVHCRNFGPSGLTVRPPHGLTQGYTCRMKATERHKSFVLLDAISDSLQNVIHHFTLKPGYRSYSMKPYAANINHYKYQVWDDFKAKFQRRAATYVADWTDDQNHSAKDRLPGLGIRPVKPLDWEKRFCEVQDHDIRDYTRMVFGLGMDNKSRLAWE